jgi:hypothetical protein
LKRQNVSEEKAAATAENSATLRNCFLGQPIDGSDRLGLGHWVGDVQPCGSAGFKLVRLGDLHWEGGISTTSLVGRFSIILKSFFVTNVEYVIVIYAHSNCMTVTFIKYWSYLQ